MTLGELLGGATQQTIYGANSPSHPDNLDRCDLVLPTLIVNTALHSPCIGQSHEVMAFRLVSPKQDHSDHRTIRKQP